jgi:hypothetical protein
MMRLGFNRIMSHLFSENRFPLPAVLSAAPSRDLEPSGRIDVTPEFRGRHAALLVFPNHSIMKEGHAYFQGHRRSIPDAASLELDLGLCDGISALWSAAKTIVSLHRGNPAFAPAPGAGANQTKRQS